MSGPVLVAYGLSSLAPVAPALRSLSRKKLGYSAIRLANHSTAIHRTPLLTKQSVITAKCSSKTALCPPDSPSRLWPPHGARAGPCPATSSIPYRSSLLLCPATPSSALGAPGALLMAACFCTRSAQNGVAGFSPPFSFWLKHHLLGEAFFLSRAWQST